MLTAIRPETILDLIRCDVWSGEVYRELSTQTTSNNWGQTLDQKKEADPRTNLIFVGSFTQTEILKK